jgi:N-acetylmuramic acid 6-phosphate etherase
MVLNMLSTAALVKLGYVSGNRMSNLQARNSKLRARAVRILMSESGMDEVNAERALNVADGDIRIALVMTKTACGAEKAKQALEESKGIVPQAITLLLNQ